MTNFSLKFQPSSTSIPAQEGKVSVTSIDPKKRQLLKNKIVPSGASLTSRSAPSLLPTGK